jgi:tRNA-modifying protein YgfZ
MTPHRTLWTVTGKDALSFLQGLVSNDLRPLEAGPGIVWAALLTPQGKYLADFFVLRRSEGDLVIDIATSFAVDTLLRLTLYRLRADVQFAPSALHLRVGQSPCRCPARSTPPGAGVAAIL